MGPGAFCLKKEGCSLFEIGEVQLLERKRVLVGLETFFGISEVQLLWDRGVREGRIGLGGSRRGAA